MAPTKARILRQTWALTKKNLKIVVVRCWLSTIIRVLVVPIALVALALEIPNYGGGDPNTYGVGSPATVPSFAETLSDGKPLAVVESPGLGPDFAGAYDRLTGGLNSNLILHVDSVDDIHNACNVDFHGNSNCHAVVIYNDTPLSGRPNATWNYTVLVDPASVSGVFDVPKHDNAIESFLYPLQLAIENAMTNSSAIPETLTIAIDYSSDPGMSPKDQFLRTALYILSFVFFISMCTMVQHVASMMAKERERGLSQLADAMSGGMSAARIISNVITFDLLYLPTWIVLGVFYGRLLCPTSSAAIFIFWQILNGWAVTSASVFATTFFSREIVASSIVPGLSLFLAVLAAWQDNKALSPPPLAEMVGLSLFFPSCGFVFFFDFAVKAEMLAQPINLVAPFPLNGVPHIFTWQGIPSWIYQADPIFVWIFFIVQIFVYLVLAIVVEHFLHWNCRPRRTFDTAGAADTSVVAIETIDLKKYFSPLLWRRLFCAARRHPTKAVDELSFVSYKHQILCLLGPNGSGKTTTLDMMAGLTEPTAGSIRIHAGPTEIGVCPQKNVLWHNLSVYEHLRLWSSLKGGSGDVQEFEALLEMCDLTQKRHSRAKDLSGGTKRKLQLACMLVGGSSVCLMDEATSGLDPVSRRVIWNAVLQERERRTIVLTTHFLDECEVLADHIVILSHGKLKCQGRPAELKAQYGGGWRVQLPKTADLSGIAYPVVEMSNHLVATTPDAPSAIRLMSELEKENKGDSKSDSGNEELSITGPTVEDVFLAVSGEELFRAEEVSSETSAAATSPCDVEPESKPVGQRLFLPQFRALFLKRCLVMRSQWWSYVFVLAIPIIFCTPAVIGPFLYLYEPPTCAGLITAAEAAQRASIINYPTWAIGPETANASIVAAAVTAWDQLAPGEEIQLPFAIGPTAVVENTTAEFLSYVDDNYEGLIPGGIFLGNDSAPLVAALINWDIAQGLGLMNVANAARTGVNIAMYYGELLSLQVYPEGSSVLWISVVCLLHAVWPAFFALYPTYERKAKVRALQYSNGVRPLPLWFSHALFDLVFAVIIAAACTGVIASQAPWWGLSYIAGVQLLYGIAAMLVSYILSLFSTSQPAACVLAIAVMIVEYVISIIVVITSSSGLNFNQATFDGTTYGLGIVFPIQNLLRAYMLGLNEFTVRCRGTESVDDPGSIYAYGGPIMLLIIQIVALFILLLYLDGRQFTPRTRPSLAEDSEKGRANTHADVDTEATRVQASTGDLLRIIHVSKRFGPCKAVDDLSLGLQRGEILALLGSNGAGKTTTINMIRGELAPTSGDIFLENASVQTSTGLAQGRLGVCPQFDALDLLTVSEHLTFYARCKGVPNVAVEVNSVLAKVGLVDHAHKFAAKLSGGNKRKLSLAIALLGSPSVLLLDEPSTAMDAVSKRVFWRALRTVALGRSVLLTTHSMEEADHVATRAAILAAGHLLAVGTTQDLRRRYGNTYHGQLVLHSAPVPAPAETDTVVQWLRQICPRMQLDGVPLGGQLRFVVPAEAGLEGRLIAALEANKEKLGLSCYSIGSATMESVFMSVVKTANATDEAELKPWWRRLI